MRKIDMTASLPAGSLRRAGWRILFLPVFLVFFSPFNRVKAQEEFISQPSQFVTSFPFRMLTGGIILVKARLGNFPDSLNFIFDTGSAGISLDSTTCLNLHIESLMSDRTIRGIAGIRRVRFIYNQTLRLPGLVVDSLNFHIGDYDMLTSVYGEKIDGIVGYSFFSRYILKINYDSLRINVLTRGPIKYPRGGFLLRPIFAGLPIQSARVKEDADILSRFYFDTGAGLCLLLSADFVSDSGLMKSNRKKMLPTQAEGLGGKAEMKLTTVKELRLGPYRFRNVPSYIFDDEYNVTSYPSLGGLIGNDILRRFNIILNYDRREIHLIPNTHYRDQFDYSYTGLGFYWIDGQIEVGDVMKDSPADLAGFQEGDIIIAVNNDVSKNIQAYKSVFQNPGEKIKVVIQRKGDLKVLTLKVKSIL